MCEVFAMTNSDPSEKSALARALKDRVGLSASYAHEIAHGQRTPSLKMAVKIERMLGIAPASWLNNEPLDVTASNDAPAEDPEARQRAA